MSEEALIKIEQRVETIEEAISIMKTLLVSHDERLGDYFEALNKERLAREESRKDFEFKMNAVIEMQMQNESEIRELKQSTIELRKASQSQLKRVENLENK